jgi:hypothetical protein
VVWGFFICECGRLPKSLTILSITSGIMYEGSTRAEQETDFEDIGCRGTQ